MRANFENSVQDECSVEMTKSFLDPFNLESDFENFIGNCLARSSTFPLEVEIILSLETRGGKKQKNLLPSL